MSSSDDWSRPFADLAGRRVLVSGSSRGIGAAVARGFAACGARVAVHHARSEADARAVLAAIGGEAAGHALLQADLAEPGEAARMVAAAATALGGLDVLVNNAGAPYGRLPLDTIRPEQRRGIVQLNLDAVIEAIQAAVPWLAGCGDGAVVNTTSIAARSGGGAGVTVYAAAKGGVEALTRGLAKELAPRGIRVNCVEPGYVDTAIHDGFTGPAETAAYLAVTPARRVGTPEECVGAFLFLAGRRTGGFITGQTIAVNGGAAMF
ncbi:MAG: SDR family NAD(P)-dependent oxidoreductase [Burkholderiales bacterium]|jgi:3-oxoacyl-[acyl-carrier protein] reductase